jgi:hypothetical protein
MIVFSKDKKDLFLEYKKQYSEILKSRNVDLVPIEIKGNLWILPEQVLTDERFLEFNDYLSKEEVREVKQEELITINP